MPCARPVLQALINLKLEPIFHLFTQCLKSGFLPSQWKIDMITPIPKKGSLTEIKNYRPISLLCVLSKVLERIIYHKVIEFIRPKLSEFQFGFLKNRSALQQLLAAFALMHNALDNKMHFSYLDFRKAFDTVATSL